MSFVRQTSGVSEKIRHVPYLLSEQGAERGDPGRDEGKLVSTYEEGIAFYDDRSDSGHADAYP